MDCLRMPVSLDDAQSIIAQCAGPDWRTQFLLGLQSLVVIIIASALIAIAVVSVAARYRGSR